MNEAVIPRSIVNRILAHAQQGGEAEVCGLVAARNGVCTQVYPIANAAPDRTHRFVMEPTVQIDAMRRMREAGEELFAIYHSHPHAPAAPSPTDLAEAAYPEALYLIVSLNTEGVLEMQGFRLKEQHVFPVPLVVA
jgi:proteasome lid subunit RPN8/RPN11